MLNKSKVVELSFDYEPVLRADAKEFIDYLSDSIVKKHNIAMTKRNIYLSTIDVFYKLGLVVVVVKYFPEFIAFFLQMKTEMGI